MTLSIVLPCYNPPPLWEKNIAEHYDLLSSEISVPIQWLLVFDGTGQHVSEDQKNYLRKEIPGIEFIEYEVNRGKCYATRQGVAATTGDFIIYTDVDFPYSVESILKIYTSLSSNESDIAVGVKGEDYYNHVPYVRRFISRYLRGLTRIFLSLPVTDTQCGLKGFNKKASALFLETTIDRYLFDLEFLRNAYRSKKFRIKPVVVHLNPNVQFRKMNYRVLLPELRNFLKILISRGK